MDDYKELRFVLDGIMADRVFIDIASAPMLVKLLAERDALLDQIELRRKAHALLSAEACALIDERDALREALQLYQHAVESGMVDNDLRAAYTATASALKEQP